MFRCFAGRLFFFSFFRYSQWKIRLFLRKKTSRAANNVIDHNSLRPIQKSRSNSSWIHELNKRIFQYTLKHLLSSTTSYKQIFATQHGENGKCLVGGTFNALWGIKFLSQDQPLTYQPFHVF